MTRKKSKLAEDSRLYRWFGPAIGATILFVLEIAQIFIIAIAIMIPIRYFLISPFIVKGASMEPTFHNSDYLIITKFNKEFTRGDVVVFEPPNNSSQYYIKRIIGLPGETVEIKEGVVIIFNDDYPNGIEVEEEYINEYTHGESRHVLGEGEYFVLGDNRDHSLDSRNIGPIPVENIIGHVWFRGLPISDINAFSAPEYNF